MKCGLKYMPTKDMKCRLKVCPLKLRSVGLDILSLGATIGRSSGPLVQSTPLCIFGCACCPAGWSLYPEHGCAGECTHISSGVSTSLVSNGKSTETHTQQ